MDDAETPGGRPTAGASDRLIDTVVEIIAEHGFEGLSVRAVAQRAGVSIGAVQHHFPTKAKMLVAAMGEVSDREAARFRDATADGSSGVRRAAVVDLLIPSGANDVTARIWLQLASRAAVDPEQREIYSAMWGNLRTRLAEALARIVPDTDDAERRATEILALCDGLSVAVLAEGSAITPKAARSLVEQRLSEITAGR